MVDGGIPLTVLYSVAIVLAMLDKKELLVAHPRPPVAGQLPTTIERSSDFLWPHEAQTLLGKMQQNLVWASIYNVLAIPIAAGVLYPSLGIELRPEWSALLMSLSSIIVAVNAVLLKHVERDLGEPGAGRPAAPLAPATAT